jgi:NADPH:quinone reductase-like Zn-dependent oxidoreductase
MRAAYLTEVTGSDGLTLGEISEPRPATGELMVKVRAAAVTPTELKWFPTFKRRDGQPRPFPVVPGHEFSGVVTAMGTGVSDFKIGAPVFGLNDWFTNGALAEYCVVSAAGVAARPTSVDDTRMAVVPISALTAWQGLFDRCRLAAGERVLIHGAAGAVGVFAVQLARWRGAHVVATASTANVDFVRELGTDEVIDYKRQRFEEIARDIDVLFDGVGGETLERSWSVLKGGGRAVTIASEEEGARDARAQKAFFIVEAKGAQLAEIARMIEAGTIRPFVEAVFPLEKTREAFKRAAAGGMRGKIAVMVS